MRTMAPSSIPGGLTELRAWGLLPRPGGVTGNDAPENETENQQEYYYGLQCDGAKIILWCAANKSPTLTRSMIALLDEVPVRHM